MNISKEQMQKFLTIRKEKCQSIAEEMKYQDRRLHDDQVFGVDRYWLAMAEEIYDKFMSDEDIQEVVK